MITLPNNHLKLNIRQENMVLLNCYFFKESVLALYLSAYKVEYSVFQRGFNLTKLSAIHLCYKTKIYEIGTQPLTVLRGTSNISTNQS